jgi:hypothetical protein
MRRHDSGGDEPAGADTKSLWPPARSSCARDALRRRLLVMDVVAIALGIVTFAILLVLIDAVDRI